MTCITSFSSYLSRFPPTNYQKYAHVEHWQLLKSKKPLESRQHVGNACNYSIMPQFVRNESLSAIENLITAHDNYNERDKLDGIKFSIKKSNIPAVVWLKRLNRCYHYTAI